LRNDLFLDMQEKFNDIELSPVTPYSGTFLGYSIDKGKLFLDLKYHIENKKLDSQNKVFLDQFTLGKKVESTRATNLPVRLAVALLKDRKGEIHLDIPVTGRTDDPKFSVWGVVLQILKNLLVKAATSPFALLSSAFGGKEDFSAIHFAPGSSQLSDAEKEKIRKLAQALNDRPALKLEVAGYVDREQDPEGYRNELLTKKIRNEKFLALIKEKKAAGGEISESVTVSPEEYPVYLKTVYKKEKFPKPRNMVGLVKDIPDAEMKKLILANTVVGEENLKTLARERATAVRTALVTDGKFPPERIFEKSGNIYKPTAKEGDAGSRVEFGVVIQ
jgi:outer membrane protein OmpA-like peptidoglycan-associated protein